MRIDSENLDIFIKRNALKKWNDIRLLQGIILKTDRNYFIEVENSFGRVIVSV